MEREAKAKVVASVWGSDFVKFLAALAVLPRWVWKKRLNSSYSSKSTEAKQLARQGIERNLPPKQTQRPLLLLLSPSFFYSLYLRTFVNSSCFLSLWSSSASILATCCQREKTANAHLCTTQQVFRLW